MKRRVARVLVADDHEIVRRGICNLLEAHGYEVVGEAEDGHTAVELSKNLSPDVVILDIKMPRLNGLEAARRIRRQTPSPEILVLSMGFSEQMVREVLEAGARGYILKSDAARHLASGVEALYEHRLYFTAVVSQQLVDSFLAQSARRESSVPSEQELTGREREILQLLAEGKSNKDIATLLNLSVKTVETHRSNLMRKLGFHGLSDLIHYAVRNNLIVP